MPHLHIHSPLKGRQCVATLDPKELTNLLGENYMSITMAMQGWRSSSGKQMDDQKVDCTYRLGVASIDVQLKSTRLIGGSWHWHVFSSKSSKKESEQDFYKAPHTFLFLTGIEIENNGSSPIVGSEPTTALIPGREVIKYFVNRPRGRVISLSKNKLLRGESELARFFFQENITAVLEESKREQESEEELNKKRRENISRREDKQN